MAIPTSATPSHLPIVGKKITSIVTVTQETSGVSSFRVDFDDGTYLHLTPVIVGLDHVAIDAGVYDSEDIVIDSATVQNF